MIRKDGFTLVEIMIVAAIIALLAVIVFPEYVKARKNGQRRDCLHNLEMIDRCKHRWADESGATNGSSVTWDQLCVYMREQYQKDLTNALFCPAAAATNRSPANYTLNVVGVGAVCNVVGPGGGHSITNKQSR